MKLADHLKKHARPRKIFAADIGVSEPALSRYIRGEQIPARRIMARIVAVTAGEVTPNDFYGVPAAGNAAEAAAP